MKKQTVFARLVLQINVGHLFLASPSEAKLGNFIKLIFPKPERIIGDLQILTKKELKSWLPLNSLVDKLIQKPPAYTFIFFVIPPKHPEHKPFLGNDI